MIKVIHIGDERIEYKELSEIKSILDKHRIKLGNWIKLGDWVKLGDGSELGNRVKLGKGVNLGKGVKLGKGVNLGNKVELGNRVELKDGVELGDYVELGDGVRLSSISKIMEIKNGYKYMAHTVPDENGPFKIRMGCLTETPEWWHKHFYDTEEFPVGTQEMKDRLETINMMLLANGYEKIEEMR